MPPPELIELHPLLPGAVRAEVTVPGSKSITNRALILAALGTGRTELRGALWSEDTRAMVDCLTRLGFQAEVSPDPAESGNRRISVLGLGGTVPAGGSAERPLELFVGNAGTAARFVAAFCCLGRGVYRISGVPRMHERPQAALFQSLRQLGYRVDAVNGRLPAIIYGEGPRPGECLVSIEESSQFASALMLSGGVGGWRIAVVGENADESPYVKMTADLIDQFPRAGGIFEIEPDASSASYLWAADWLLGRSGAIRVAGWMEQSGQIDARFPEVLRAFPDTISRRDDLGDAIMTAIVLAPWAAAPKKFTHLGRLRAQECERVLALRTELTRCGAKVDEQGDTLTVYPGALHGAEIETYQDHRMAMCFATLGLRVPGIRLRNPACVGKTFPNFFQKLAAPPPAGLGVRVTEPRTGRALRLEELHWE